jgi:hypothetical protein
MVNKVMIQQAIINVDFEEEEILNEIYDEIQVKLLLDD